jgi:hypothetical protein
MKTFLRKLLNFITPRKHLECFIHGPVVILTKPVSGDYIGTLTASNQHVARSLVCHWAFLHNTTLHFLNEKTQ